MKARIWIELASGAVGAALAFVSSLWPQWIEMLFDAEPDGGSGEAEWLVTALFLLVAVVSFALAGFERRRARTQSAGVSKGQLQRRLRRAS
jgi:uncharacterized membrane protein SirB2